MEKLTPSGLRAQDTANTSTDTFTSTTPNGSSGPTGSVVVPGMDRSEINQR